MSRSPMYDPQTSEARSPWLAGLTEICNKLSGVLNMETAAFDDLTLSEVYISEEDRCRIYQAPLGNKLWLQTPAPVIKKNGITITPETDGFEIDYLGGSIAFDAEYTLQPTDIVTASATYIVDKSVLLDAIRRQFGDIAEKAESFKGNFDTLDSLTSAYDVAEPGDYAVVQDGDTIYIWSEVDNAWVDVHKGVDLSDYLTDEQTQALLDKKQDNIPAKGNTTADDMFYYGGRKTWVNLANKVLGIAISGLANAESEEIEATDTLLEALAKLQAQIKESSKGLSGNQEPTIDTEGIIGQDYTNLSNGDKYHLVSIETGDGYTDYNWEQYADVSSMKKYVDDSIRTSVMSAWKKDY